jgi:hypothetical protein
MTTGEPSKRASRFEREANPKRFVLTKRDKDVIASVNQYRLLSQSQIQRLHFPSRNTTQDRLLHLWQHIYLRRLYTNGFVTGEALYTLDRRGIELLQAERGLSKDQVHAYKGKIVNPLSLDHTLALADIRIDAELSARRHGLQIAAWLDDLATKASYDRVPIENHSVPIIPDGYFTVIDEGGTFHFLLEYDAGTEGLTTIERKFRAYQLYLESGRCEKRYGTNKVRVLFIIKKPGRRLDNVRRTAKNLPLSFHFWISHKQAIADDFFTAPVWFSGQKEAPAPLLVSTFAKGDTT